MSNQQQDSQHSSAGLAKRPQGASKAHPKNYSPEALREKLADSGLPGYRAEQLSGWLYQRGVDDLAQMTDLSRDLQEQLGRHWRTRALEIAQDKKTLSLELRAAVSLGRLWTKQGQPERARELLAPIYARFTEGFDCPDLVEARALLEG